MTKSNGRKKKEAMSGVTESTLIDVKNILEQFNASHDDVYTFKAGLTNRDRAAVHKLCRKFGMKSKSSGRGEGRRVSVFKTKKKDDKSNKEERLSSFTFSQRSRAVLQDLFSHYPPDSREVDDYNSGNSNRTIKTVQVTRDGIFSKAPANKSKIREKVKTAAVTMENSPNLKKITEDRSKLPIASFKDNITSIVESHQVVLISGETGCGKTTQVPQYLLDYMWTKGEACKIVCTQPRRISAISVAERISTERGETIGDTVGYKIRLESKGGAHSSIVFCTNGILMRVLIGRRNGEMEKDALADITHIIVDEIHERDRYSDFMLAIIRDVLPLYPHLRLILMSATLDAERFANYFGGCPTIRVPGFTYPVSSFYLEDVLSIITSNETNHLAGITSSDISVSTTILTEEYKASLDESINLALLSDEFDSLLDYLSSEGGSEVLNYRHSSTGVSPLMVFAGKGRVGDICMLLSLGADPDMQDNDGRRAVDWAEQEDQEEATEIIKRHMEKSFPDSDEKKRLLDKYFSNVDPELVDTVLIEQLLRRICVTSETGAVLIFLPGWDDIKRTRERLDASSYFKDTSKFVIISLHSMVPPAEQKKIFFRPPPGCRKIILSTNIAETAVTIDDVVYVIDSGRMKEKNYDPYNNVSTLQSSWISKASARQREGRAGRCQPGICYHLYSNIRAASLPDFQIPEIKRMPVEELCLQFHNPPDDVVDKEGWFSKLTSLSFSMTNHSIYRCTTHFCEWVKLVDPDCKIEDFLNKTLDPPIYETVRNAIIVLQDIGALSPDERLTELGEKLGSLPVHPLTSKMLLVAILLDCLDPALTLACAFDYRDPFTLPMLPHEKKKAAAARSELASMFLGRGDQLAIIAAFDCWRNARERGQESRFCSEYFVSSGTMHMISKMRNQLQSELVRNGFIPKNESHCSSNARDPGMLHAVLVAGLYPMFGKLLQPLKTGQRAAILTSGGDKVGLHPHSTNFKLSFNKGESQPLVIYDEITRGDGGLHIKNCCVVGPLPLLLLATEILVAPVSETVDEDEDNEKSDDDDDNSNNDDIDDDKEQSNTAEIKRGEKIMSSPDNLVKVIIDRWLPYESMALDVAQIYCLRERLSAAILFKVKHPGKVLPDVLDASMYSMACILSYDGMSGVSSPYESVDTLTSMVSAAEINRLGPGSNQRGNHSNNNFTASTTGRGKSQNSNVHHQDTMQGSSVSDPSRGKHPKRPRGSLV
ncbi:RNA helicase [Lithospermum erythrorhizon]|uniref:RNA helicase n=1 Tax=Lithospermum erythrorhizon TaxID=34254 RepID=A0AAV3R4J4_LITER